MSNPPAKPPQQQRPPPQQQQRPAQQEQSKTQQRARESMGSRNADANRAKATEDVQSGIQTEEEVVVEGAGGARNLAYQWVDVWLPNGKPMYIVVTTLPDHELNVTIEQRSWKKNYVAKGRVQTDVTPIAPIGTTGQLVARDATTGEELKVRFSWGPIRGPSLLARLMKFVKGLFTTQKG